MLNILEDFKLQVNANPQIQRIVKSWDTDIVLEENDTATSYWMNIDRGQIGQIHLGDIANGNDNPIRIVGDGATLRAVFEGKINGIRANNDGLLEIYGQMNDQVKLDAIALILWGI
ncbi:hypothetical protein [Jeongeupia naejangsanensis]|uniref:SCP2 domain-containing protein n=1 Tax=Jeongeupia naejangsanensis TaxID=613195 RepID=A0ABS2BNC1_9NEIS|nr:hypothetical protein [Jeongeupia naejangsanensis]MBM3117043.1 hypothetical protein [Jeongeupia naejangsanensis]